MALRSPSAPYVLPFVLFLVLVAVMSFVAVTPRLDQIIRIVLVGGTLLLVSRGVLDLHVSRWAGSVILGVAVFVLWIGPDLLWAGYRELPIFRNGVIGLHVSSLAEAGRSDPVAIALRFARAALLVPIVEELFWRGWLPRWIVDHDFGKVPLGSYTRAAFWITVALFAVEHGIYWDVGLLAGIAYNWWMRATKSLGDCVLAHAVTNGCLGLYVLLAGRWEYW